MRKISFSRKRANAFGFLRFVAFACAISFAGETNAGKIYEFPKDGWKGAKVAGDGKFDLRVLDRNGKTMLSFLEESGKYLPYVKVSVEDDGIVVDTSEANRMAGGASINVVARGPRFEAPELQGAECRYKIALSGNDNDAKCRAWIIGDMYDEDGKKHWMAFGPRNAAYFRVVNSERTEYDIPFQGRNMPSVSSNYVWRFDFAGARAPVKFYGARLARFVDMPLERGSDRKVSPKLLFHASFDSSSPVADFAAGDKEPKTAKGLQFVAGRNGGRAVRFSRTASPVLSYSAKENLLRGRGSIAIWYRMTDEARKGDESFLFSSGSGFHGRIGNGFPFLWFWRDTLRFDPADDRDSYLMCGLGVSDRNWHQIVVSWNEYGRTFWTDGNPAPADPDILARALAFTDRFSCSRTAPLETFALGSQLDGSNAIDCLVDDVKIYSDALDEKGVRELWKKDRGEKPPAPDYAKVIAPANRYLGGEAVTAGRIDPSDLELIREVRFDKIPEGGEFRAVGKLAIKELCGVKYLETENVAKSRFALGLHLTDSPLHYIEVDYPDNCARTMEFMVQPAKSPGEDYCLQVGVLTGRDAAGAGSTPTGKILTHRMVLWTRDPHVAFVAMAWHKEEGGAAVAAVRAYRIKSGRLPQARMVEPAGVPKRQFGIHYEDTPLGDCFAAPGRGKDVEGFIDGVERLVATMKFTGQNIFSFPVSWYMGVNDPAVMSRHPPHFADGLMSVFDRDGVGFMAAINTSRLPVPQGLVTANTIRDGSLHSSFLSIPAKGHIGSNNSRFNIAHPETQRQVSEIVDTLLAEGVKHPSFRGITLHIHSSFVGWFGEADAGYNDYCIDAFEKRWGVKVPVDRTDPVRAEKYAKWLKANAWEKWRKWRCETVGAFWTAQAKKIKAARGDLKLWFNFQTCEWPEARHFMSEDYAEEVHLDGGLDTAAIAAACDNVIFSEAFSPADARHGILRSFYDIHPDARRHLEERWQKEKYHSSPKVASGRWIHHHDRYWESNIGSSAARGPGGAPPLTCEWLDEHPWRVSTLNPPSRDALRHFALPMRFCDPDGMTKGGFLIGTYGMEEFLVPFAQAFRALPAVPFDTVSQSDGVILRHKKVNGSDWHYIVNTTGETRSFETAFPAGTKNAVTGAEEGGRKRISLEPWELRSYRR